MTKTRKVEYYRLWAGNGGDSGTWDTDFIDIPSDTPDDELDRAVRKAARKVRWRDELPVLVGHYADTDEPEDDEPENVPCVNCGRTDLPLHTNGQCAECGPSEDDAPHIQAECHSDDRLYSAEFNALRWFRQAEDAEILDLATVDWGDEYAADRVGMFMAELIPDVEKMFDYLERYNQAHKEHIGWVCTVNKADALEWLKQCRPGLYQRVLKIEEGDDG
jgi:hypothetical protein